MGVAAALKAPNIAVKPLADVQKFMDGRDQFVFEVRVQESGNVKIQQVQILPPVRVENPLQRVLLPATNRRKGSIFESERRYGSVHPVFT